MKGKKAKSFYEVACSIHGINHRNDDHRSVKVGSKGTGCPHCRIDAVKAALAAKAELVG